jgi:hypothetical protein
VPENTSEVLIRRLREVVAAALAVVVTLFTLSMTWRTFGLIADGDSFLRSKDLLLVLTPFFGVVLGYYFNKVSTEGRAERAEQNAQAATAEALDARTKRAQAEVQTAGLREKTHGFRSGLDQLVQLGEALMSSAAPAVADSGASRLSRLAGRRDGLRTWAFGSFGGPWTAHGRCWNRSDRWRVIC